NQRVDHSDIPGGWTLLSDVDPAVLPIELRQAPRADRPAISLSGGLQLGDGVYLDGYPPRLLARALSEPLVATLNGRRIGQASRDQSLRLDLLRGVPEIIVEDVVTLRVEMAERGTREGPASRAWMIDDATRARYGATSRGTDGVHVSGALVTGRPTST